MEFGSLTFLFLLFFWAVFEFFKGFRVDLRTRAVRFRIRVAR